MIPGPVFNFETLTTARRGRFYLVRSAYALVLLLILWNIHAAWSLESGGELSSREVSWFAFSAFCGVAVGQMVLVLVLTPALVAGVIADEKQRKTLHYLLASRLSGPEIVLGKLMARMMHVGVFLGVGFPVLSLLVLLGGTDPWLVVLACAATASTAWFLAALSIWVSTIARRVREALFIAYALECLWLFLPPLVHNTPLTWYPVLGDIVSVLIDWIRASSPTGLIATIYPSLLTLAPTSFLDTIGWMIGLQLTSGAILGILASWQLRRVFHAQEGRGGRGLRLPFVSSRPTVRRRIRPALGNRPMLWKELFTARSRGFTRFVGTLVTLVGGGYLLYYTCWFGLLAFQEMRDYGYAHSDLNFNAFGERWKFFWFIRTVVPLVYTVGILGVAGASASSITSEHEEDTWTSLTSTTLTGREIVFAKLLGALWRPRGIVVAILLMALTGVAVGSISPWSLPPLLLALAVYGWFAATLGIWISFQLKSTWRAQFLTVACLLMINVVGQSVLSNLRAFAPMMWPGFTPVEIAKLLLSPRFFQELANTTRPSSYGLSAIEDDVIWHTIFAFLSLVTYGIMAAFLTWDSLRRFEIAAGRARRSSRGR